MDFGCASTRLELSRCSCAKLVAGALLAAETVVDVVPVGLAVVALQTSLCWEEIDNFDKKIRVSRA